MHYEKFQDGTVKCIEDEIPFELPNSWAYCRFYQIFDIGSSKRVLQSEWRKEGIPFYRAREIVSLSDNGYVDNDLFISIEHYEKMKKEYGVPKQNDLMVTGVGTIGKVYIVQQHDEFYYKDASVLCFKNRSGFVNAQYAKLLMESSLLKAQIHSKTYGNTVDTITISTANNYIGILPPLAEQDRIVKYVESLFNLINSINENTTDLKTLINASKNRILDLAIRGQLVPQDPNDEPASALLERIRSEKEALINQGKIKRDKKESIIFRGEDNSYYEKINNLITCIDNNLPYTVPDKWRWCSLYDIAEIVMGSSPNGMTINSSSNGIEFHQGKIFFTNKYLGMSDKTTSQPTKIAPANSVLLCVRAPVGEINISNREICIGRGLASIHPYNYINTEWLFYWLKTYKNNLNKKATGSTFVAITVDTVKNMLIPLPPLEEQSRILQAIDNIFLTIELIEKSLK